MLRIELKIFPKKIQAKNNNYHPFKNHYVQRDTR
jgi:hypothetical protein